MQTKETANLQSLSTAPSGADKHAHRPQIIVKFADCYYREGHDVWVEKRQGNVHRIRSNRMNNKVLKISKEGKLALSYSNNHLTTIKWH